MRSAPRALLLSVSLLLCACPDPIYPAGEAPCSEQVQVDVLGAHDGDTIEVRYAGGDRQGSEDDVRLIGIDTSEVDHNGDDHDCYALPAWQEILDLLEGQQAWLTYDEECTDQHGRGLAYVFADADGLFVNSHMVEEGFARACPYGANTTFSEDFEALQQEAQAELRGRWAEPCNGGPECFEGGS